MTDIRIDGFHAASSAPRAPHVGVAPLLRSLRWHFVLLGGLVLPLGALGASYAGLGPDRPYEALLAPHVDPELARAEPEPQDAAPEDITVFGALPSAVTPTSTPAPEQTPLASLKDALTHADESAASSPAVVAEPVAEEGAAVALLPAAPLEDAGAIDDAAPQPDAAVVFAPPSQPAPDVVAPHVETRPAPRAHVHARPAKAMRAKAAPEARKVAVRHAPEARVAETPAPFTLPHALQPTPN